MAPELRESKEPAAVSQGLYLTCGFCCPTRGPGLGLRTYPSWQFLSIPMQLRLAASFPGAGGPPGCRCSGLGLLWVSPSPVP